MNEPTVAGAGTAQLGQQGRHQSQHLADHLAQVTQFRLALIFGSLRPVHLIAQALQPAQQLALLEGHVQRYRPIGTAQRNVGSQRRKQLVMGRPAP
ncbi:hypothetical protein ACFSHR_02840 [Azotobacter chroococcum]